MGDIFKIHFSWVKEKCLKSGEANTSGYKAHANTSGYNAHANTSGYNAHANTSGYNAHANTSGNHAHANTSGYNAHANTSGNYAHANTSGDEAHANTSGDEAIACAIGVQSRIKIEGNAKFGILVNWIIKDDKYIIKDIHKLEVNKKVKGVKIKRGTWYWFEDDKLKFTKD